MCKCFRAYVCRFLPLELLFILFYFFLRNYVCCRFRVLCPFSHLPLSLSITVLNHSRNRVKWSWVEIYDIVRKIRDLRLTLIPPLVTSCLHFIKSCIDLENIFFRSYSPKLTAIITCSCNNICNAFKLYFLPFNFTFRNNTAII